MSIACMLKSLNNTAMQNDSKIEVNEQQLAACFIIGDYRNQLSIEFTLYVKTHLSHISKRLSFASNIMVHILVKLSALNSIGC